VYIPRDNYTMRPRGFCFVEFESEAEVQAAHTAMNRKQLGGRCVLRTTSSLVHLLCRRRLALRFSCTKNLFPLRFRPYTPFTLASPHSLIVPLPPTSEIIVEIAQQQRKTPQEMMRMEGSRGPAPPPRYDDRNRGRGGFDDRGRGGHHDDRGGRGAHDDRDRGRGYDDRDRGRGGYYDDRDRGGRGYDDRDRRDRDRDYRDRDRDRDRDRSPPRRERSRSPERAYRDDRSRDRGGAGGGGARSRSRSRSHERHARERAARDDAPRRRSRSPRGD
jgi:hypothetical protein